jgi:hypothetical protein
MHGHIGGIQQDPGESSAGITHRLAGKVHEQLPGPPAAPVNPDPGFGALDGLPSLHDSFEQIAHPLAGQFRQRLAQRHAGHAPIAGKPAVSVIGEVDNQVRSGQIGHRSRQAHKQVPDPREPVRRGVPTRHRNHDLCTPGAIKPAPGEHTSSNSPSMLLTEPCRIDAGRDVPTAANAEGKPATCGPPAPRTIVPADREPASASSQRSGSSPHNSTFGMAWTAMPHNRDGCQNEQNWADRVPFMAAARYRCTAVMGGWQGPGRQAAWPRAARMSYG